MGKAKRHSLLAMVTARETVIANAGSQDKSASSVTDKASELVCNYPFL